MKKFTLLAMFISLCLATAQAGTATYYLGYTFSGQDPVTTPYVAFFDGTDASNGFGVSSTDTVVAVIGLAGASSTEFIDEFYMNSVLNVGTAGITISGLNTSAVGWMTSQQTLDGFKADGDGDFDIFIDLPNSQADNRLNAGESITLTFTRSGGLTLSNFTTALSQNKAPGYLFATHVQGIATGDGSGWNTVPEPGLISLLGVSAAAVLVAMQHRRARRSQSN